MKIFRAAEQGIPIPDDLSLLQLPDQADKNADKPEMLAGGEAGQAEAERNPSGQETVSASKETEGSVSGEIPEPVSGEAVVPVPGEAEESVSGKAPEPSRSYDEWLDFVRDTTGADQRRDQGDSDGAE